jgi:hypothetical protein
MPAIFEIIDQEKTMIQTAPATHTFNAEIESPLIPHLMHVERGICHGHEEMRPFFRE